jgi:thiamine phosphate synthase YjbQ (UPF0047 family)
MVDITDQTLKAIFESKLENSIVTIFVSGSTAAITTIEYEPSLRVDFPMMLNGNILKDIEYKQNETWHDGKWTFTCQSFSNWTQLNCSFQR